MVERDGGLADARAQGKELAEVVAHLLDRGVALAGLPQAWQVFRHIGGRRCGACFIATDEQCACLPKAPSPVRTSPSPARRVGSSGAGAVGAMLPSLSRSALPGAASTLSVCPVKAPAPLSTASILTCDGMLPGSGSASGRVMPKDRVKLAKVEAVGRSFRRAAARCRQGGSDGKRSPGERDRSHPTGAGATPSGKR